MPSDVRVKLTPFKRRQLEHKLAELERLEQENNEKLELAKRENPFWFFQPSDGNLTEDGKRLLEKYLKPEDIPVKLDGQKDVLACTAPIVGVSGGNQAGKTLVMVLRRIILATGLIPSSLKSVFPKELIPNKSPRHYRVVGVDAINGLEKNVIPTFRHWTPREALIDGSWEKSWSAKSNTLRLVDPRTKKLLSTIEFMSNKSEVDSHQGPPMDGVDFDEEPDYDIYRENAMRLTTAERYDMQFGMTPTHGISWVYDKFFLRSKDDSGRDVAWFKLSTAVNPKANPIVVEENLKNAKNYDDLRMRLLGDFVSLSGLIYGNLFNPSIHVIDPFPITWEHYIVYRGLDPHTSKNTVCIEVAIDREGTEYVCGMYSKAADTQIVKDDLAARAIERNYRLGWTRCDRSANSTNRLLDDRNIFFELGRGKNAIPALMESQKYTGSIHAGVDEIMKRLKINPTTGKPSLFIFNLPELKPLIHSFRTLERDTYRNEERKGVKDKINEGPHDAHAALRYCHQSIMNWMPPHMSVPSDVPVNESVGW